MIIHHVKKMKCAPTYAQPSTTVLNISKTGTVIITFKQRNAKNKFSKYSGGQPSHTGTVSYKEKCSQGVARPYHDVCRVIAVAHV